jgi:hypothetical protein
VHQELERIVYRGPRLVYFDHVFVLICSRGLDATVNLIAILLLLRFPLPLRPENLQCSVDRLVASGRKRRLVKELERLPQTGSKGLVPGVKRETAAKAKYSQ